MYQLKIVEYMNECIINQHIVHIIQASTTVIMMPFDQIRGMKCTGEGDLK